MKTTCGDIWMAYGIGASSQEKKSEAGEKQAKYGKEERRRAFLPSWQKNRPWLKFVPASLSASATSIANCFGWRQYVLRNLPVGFPVRPIIGPEKCFCRCRLHIASPGVHQDPRNIFKPFKGYNDHGRKVRAGEDSRL